MKKTIALLLVLTLAFAVFAAGANETKTAAPAASNKTAEELHDDMVAAAKAGGDLSIYTYSSRTAKTAAAFQEAYGIPSASTQLKDSEMVTKVSTEAAANLDGADVILAQDGARLYPELIATGYVTTYIPDSIKDVINERYTDPLVYEYCTKLFIYNDELGKSNVSNVWQLTEPEYAGKIQMKDAFQEGVNLNFLTMLTSPEWSQKLADAYKELYGKDIVLTTKNAGYEWIKMFYKNCVLGKSDTTIAENVGAKGQATQLWGLFTSNKLRDKESKNLALQPQVTMKPFAGFMYPVYAFIPSNSKNTEAAKLFLEFAYSDAGWAPYNNLIGDYSPVHPNAEDEITLEQYTEILVVEDPVWCAENRADVEEFISTIMSK